MFTAFIGQTPLEEAPRLGMVFQGLYDTVPVVLFLIGSIILLRALYNKMVKGCYVLLASGSIMVFVAGFLKALHKILLGVAEVDYTLLSNQFTTTQSIGFFLLFVGLIGMFTKFNKNYTKVRSIAVLPFLGLFAYTATVFDSSMPFIVMMILGAAGSLGVLIYMAARMKSVPAIILFSVAVVAMVGMGYLSTKRFYEYAWIAISTNVIYQGCFLLGVILLNKKGLHEESIFFKESN